MLDKEQNLRKRDFKVELWLPKLEDENQDDYNRCVKELIDAISEVETSFLSPRLSLWLRQPVIGDVTNSVIRVCKFGVQRCKLRTLFPGRPDLDQEDCSHIVYDYSVGDAVEQRTVFARNDDEMLLHGIVISFKKFRVDTNVLDRQQPQQARPPLSLVVDTGSDLQVVGSARNQ